MLTVDETIILRRLLADATVKGPANGRVIVALDDKLSKLQAEANIEQARALTGTADGTDAPAGD